VGRPTAAPRAAATGAARPDPTGRVLAGASLGLVGGVAGFVVGFYGTAGLATVAGDDDCSDSCGVEALGWAVLGGTAVALVGLSVGTYAGSQWVGGDGSLGWTALGGLGGAAIALGAGLLEVRTDSPAPLIVGTLIVVPLVGATLGYELSAADAETAASGAVASVGIAPVAGGACLGVSGRF
jgi:hypothetical protein